MMAPLLAASPLARVGATHALSLAGVGRTFAALVAIEDISFDVAAGERRAIIGANGASKTTLFNAITGDFPPTSGRVRFFGEDITDLPPHQRIRRGLRRTYQSAQLFGGLTVLDNLLLAVIGVTRRRFSVVRPGARDHASASARELAAHVHLDAVIDAPVATLSHGQQRQLEVGMALAGAPRFILFDEPAAGLSPPERRDLIQLLRMLPEYVGFIIIEHDLDVALQVVGAVTVMHNGRVIKHGTPDVIRDDPEVQAIYLGTRHGATRHG